jgi:hypothetical protein
MSANGLFLIPENPCPSLHKGEYRLLPVSRSKVEACMLLNILHMSSWQMFQKNPYLINNVDDMWELVLADICSLVSHDGHRYLLNAIDGFSKYAYSVPIPIKMTEAVSYAFCS